MEMEMEEDGEGGGEEEEEEEEEEKEPDGSAEKAAIVEVSAGVDSVLLSCQCW